MLLSLALIACKGELTIVGEEEETPTSPATETPISTCDRVDVGEGEFLEQGIAVSTAMADCETGVHAFAGAGGSTVELLWHGPDAMLEIIDFNDTVLAAEFVVDGDRLDYALGWSGEHRVRAIPQDGGAVDYILMAECVEGCDLAYTRYPMFFMHGMAGTDSFLDQLAYWYDVRETLEPMGYATFAEWVDPFQSSEVRAIQWMEHLDTIKATGQHRRFNLVAHSQGGIDARYLATMLDIDDRVVSVTTISTPHRGTELLGVVSGLVDNPGILGWMVDGAVDTLLNIYDTENEQDLFAQLETLSPDTMAEFNDTIVDREDVLYFSWAGDTCQLVDVFCQFNLEGEIVTPLFGATHAALLLLEGDNDGLVSVESSRWGEFLGIMPADHLDEVGLFPGTTAPGFDHLQFYRDEAARLRVLGL